MAHIWDTSKQLMAVKETKFYKREVWAKCILIIRNERYYPTEVWWSMSQRGFIKNPKNEVGSAFGLPNYGILTPKKGTHPVHTTWRKRWNERKIAESQLRSLLLWQLSNFHTIGQKSNCRKSRPPNKLSQASILQNIGLAKSNERKNY